jgi:hypothetical protein
VFFDIDKVVHICLYNLFVYIAFFLNKSGAGKTRFFGTTEIKNISVGMGIGLS